MPNTGSYKAIYFITEQACCLVQAHGRETGDFRACMDTAAYLADGDAKALNDFRERTDAARHDATGLKDYDTENYEGKKQDVREAVSALSFLGAADDTPEDIRGSLLKTADIIAAFYGVDNVIEAVSM